MECIHNFGLFIKRHAVIQSYSAGPKMKTKNARYKERGYSQPNDRCGKFLFFSKKLHQLNIIFFCLLCKVFCTIERKIQYSAMFQIKLFGRFPSRTQNMGFHEMWSEQYQKVTSKKATSRIRKQIKSILHIFCIRLTG